jgi:hypothetical protein
MPMDRIGTVAQAVLRGSRPGLANGRLAKAIVPTTRECDLPALFVPEIDRELPRLVAFWEGGSASDDEHGERARRGTPVLRRPFTEAERSALEERVWSLSCAVAPPQEAHRNALLASISGMLGAFPMMQRHDELTGLAMVASYLWSAREQPHWAILKACNMVRSGIGGLNRAFCPSEPEFNTIAGRCAEAYVDALRRTKRLLAAKVDTPSAGPKPPLSKAALEVLARAHGWTPCDGGHAERVKADLEARRWAREDPPMGG